MKKKLLKLGTPVAILVPLMTVVSCGAANALPAIPLPKGTHLPTVTHKPAGTESTTETSLTNNANQSNSKFVNLPKQIPELKPKAPSVRGLSDGSIDISNSFDENSQLQYSLNLGSTWSDIPNDGKIESLKSGPVKFRWISKNGNQYLGLGVNYKELAPVVVPSSKIIPIPSDSLTFTATSPSSINGRDGQIALSNFTNPYATLKYSVKQNTWIDVPNDGKILHLRSGSVYLEWVTKNGEKFTDQSSSHLPLIKGIKGFITISKPAFISKPSDPVFHASDPSVKNKNDGKITISGFRDSDSKLQYSIDGNTWIDVLDTGEIDNLAPGKVQFRWVGQSGQRYMDKSSSKDVSSVVTIHGSNVVPVPASIRITPYSPTSSTSADGKIVLSGYQDKYSKLEYSTNNGVSWSDVTKTTFSNLLGGTSYQFKWVTKNGEIYQGINQNEKVIGTTNIPTPAKVVPPVVPQVANPVVPQVAKPVVPQVTQQKTSNPKPTAVVSLASKESPTVAGRDNGDLTLTNFSDSRWKLQYSTDGSSWIEIPSSGEIYNLPSGNVELRWAIQSSSAPGGYEYSVPTMHTITINDPDVVPKPVAITVTSSATTSAIAQDGKIVLSGYQDKYSKLEYSIDNGNSWNDVTRTSFLSLKGGTSYQFKWVTKNGETYENSNDKEVVVGTYNIAKFFDKDTEVKAYRKKLTTFKQIADITEDPYIDSLIIPGINHGNRTFVVFDNGLFKIKIDKTLIGHEIASIADAKTLAVKIGTNVQIGPAILHLPNGFTYLANPQSGLSKGDEDGVLMSVNTSRDDVYSENGLDVLATIATHEYGHHETIYDFVRFGKGENFASDNDSFSWGFTSNMAKAEVAALSKAGFKQMANSVVDSGTSSDTSSAFFDPSLIGPKDYKSLWPNHQFAAYTKKEYPFAQTEIATRVQNILSYTSVNASHPYDDATNKAFIAQVFLDSYATMHHFVTNPIYGEGKSTVGIDDLYNSWLHDIYGIGHVRVNALKKSNPSNTQYGEFTGTRLQWFGVDIARIVVKGDLAPFDTKTFSDTKTKQYDTSFGYKDQLISDHLTHTDMFKFGEIDLDDPTIFKDQYTSFRITAYDSKGDVVDLSKVVKIGGSVTKNEVEAIPINALHISNIDSNSLVYDPVANDWPFVNN